ncbi:type VI secretion system-associated protein TagF [Pseudomonas alkylphenolica]|uniref:Type VI secretion system-associated protein TagF n=1 Tax=Pseudomonas alkylphenolica TaxID=237609 RepID=A0A6I6GYP1_9PSED|nr:type VI secretion system-associated protein TagF [Pseudomonas alkylphenolica]QGW77086.1 type VI secretion system-associated protein TagF [Pseudomonas alkylphenolica]
MIGCFGKLPASADFVSLHGAAEEVCEFDAWLQGALAAMRHRDDWPTLFERLPVCFFSYRAGNGNWLLGGLISSHDASNRRYPFFIFQLIKPQDGEPLVNPFTLGELFCAQIKPLLHLAVQGSCSASLFERIKAMRPLQGQDFDLFRRVHAKFLQDFSFADITTALNDTYPAFDSTVALTRLQALAPLLHNACEAGIGLPLPAQRGLKNPTADLWVTWLTRMRGGNVPPVSLLADDFMRPKLYSFPSRHSANAYRVLSATAEAAQHIELLTPDELLETSRRSTPLADIDRPLDHVIDRFVDALDATFV